MISASLQRLIALGGDFRELMEDTQKYLWSMPRSQEAASVALTLDDLDRALRFFEEGFLSSEQLQEWADVLEMNDWVQYEPGVDEAIADILFRLSTPEINDPINQDLVKQLRAAISRLHRPS